MKLICRYIVVLLLTSFSGTSIAQTYGNEWIDYSQNYYSFKIVQNGVYRLDHAALVAAGIPVGSFLSENIQVFGKEKEIPLHIYDGGDNSLDSGDYVIFYAERNDGWMDSTLYSNPNTIGNPAYSLYNDTLLYFFTWNSGSSNLRYSVETDVAFASFPNVTSYITSFVEKNHNEAYFEGIKTKWTSSSFFTPGEGWGKTKVNGVPSGYTANLTLSTPLPYSGPGAPSATFKGLSVSASDADIPLGALGNHHLMWLIGTDTLLNTIYTGYNQVICSSLFASTLLTNGNTAIKWKIINDQGAATDYQSYSYYSISYPRIPNFQGSNNMTFKVANDPQGKIRLDIASAGYSSPIVLIHGDTPRMVPFIPNAGGHSMLIPNSGNGAEQTVIYKDSSLLLNITSLTPVNGTGLFTDFLTTEDIEAALIMIHHPNTEASAINYKGYRESGPGGLYNPLMADVNELYMQFGGGIEKHINGIRRFVHYIYNNATNKPVGLFLLGKGIREATNSDVTADGPGARKVAARFQQSLIPSFGQPSSDNCITAGLEGTSQWAPLIATGRISVRSNAELDAYLTKVMEYEAEQDPTMIYDTPSKDWQKQILHFAGGSDIGQQEDFQGFLNDMESIVEDTLYGGYVNKIYKTSSNPLDPQILNGITERIEEGVSLMTYFGHATATNSGFEINLDDPVNWNNHLKYPVMLVNSCYNGNIFQLNYSKSEEFVQAPSYGAIAYIASVSTGLDQILNIYSQGFYQKFSRDNYGESLGEIMKQNIQSLETPGNFYKEANYTQMTLNGDPMLSINSHQNPEIELTVENVSFSPTNLNLTVDSIEMQIILTNLGHSTLAPFPLEVRRNFPSSSVDSVYLFQINTLNYKDTITFKMPLQPNISIGVNAFSISADLPSAINEQYDEINNNQIVKTFFIDIDGIVPVIPYEFAVVPRDTVTVKASTINPIADYNVYRFELDTTDLFDSPEHRYAVVSGFGGVKEVRYNEWLSVSSGMPDSLICTDSTVYFWRVALDSSVYDWKESSFQYIINKEGWGQDHFFQFKKNGFFGIDYDRPTRTRNFGPFMRTVECDALATSSYPGVYYNQWLLDGAQQDYGYCAAGLLHVAVIDSTTLTPWGTRYVPQGENLGNNFGNSNDNGQCANRVMKYFTFSQNDPVQLASFQNMVNNVVPNGNYILIYAPVSAQYNTWNSLDSVGMYNTFAGLGSDSINGSRPNTPMAFLCKKGYPNSVVELFGATALDDVHLQANIFGNSGGRENSTLIGPAAQWGNVYWKQDPSEPSSQDSTILTIKAYDISGALQFQIDTLFTLNDSILNLNGLIDASLYPYIDLSAYYIDLLDNTPAQIDRWHVLFTPLPEAAIDGSTAFLWSVAGDTLEEGQSVDFAVDIKNIFTVDMDSLLVSYWVEDENQVKHPIAYARQKALLVNDVFRDTVTINTTGFGGLNIFWMEVNPYVNGSLFVTDQPEQEHFNNILQIPFVVRADDKNPILDVTFNGNHILNGDIIDPNSEIIITLKDDNEFLIMDNISDTTLFGVYISDPAGQLYRIPFVDATGGTVMQWIPADQQSKRFKIIWPTEFEMDGDYTLLVQGSDRSGNISGDLEYRVNFEIIHETSITRMMNYPNPFSTSTRFVFTLTGSVEPDEIIIQIMTVTGRVVREITEDQLGLITIGRNITEYAWDGTDEFGDRLANGVYLYRVKAQINGEDIKHRDSGADSHFKKDFGKMYLFR